MAPPAEATASRWWIDSSGRAVALVVLAVAAAAWAALLISPAMPVPGMHAGAASMMAPSGAAMAMGDSASAAWSWPDLLTFTAAWALMMAAMMLPSATPMIALYSMVARRRELTAIPLRTALFVAPYMALWALSGVPVYAATVAIGWLMRGNGWAAMSAPYLVAATLLAAAAYQFTPLKRMCLSHCRNPLNFLASRWRPGLGGAAAIGLAHAWYCFGCCAMLMVVLVAAGAMGLPWVLLIAAIIAAEKLLPRRLPAPAVAGAALVILGIAVAVHPVLVGYLHG